MRCFSLNTKEINDKLSVETYWSEYREHSSMLEEIKYPIVILNELIYDIKDGAHKKPVYHEDGIKFVMSNNVKKDGINFDEVKYVSKSSYYSLINSAPKYKDILFTKIGAKFGVAAVVPKNSPVFTIFVSTSVLKGINLKLINPYYLSIYLNSKFTRLQIDSMVKGIGVPDLHLEQIGEIKIILPPMKVQESIIKKTRYYNDIIKNLKRRIIAIRDIYENILYNSLGIKKTSNDNKKYFKISSSNLNGRTDVRFYSSEEKSINIEKGHKFMSLASLCWNVSSGQRPTGGVKYATEGIPNLGGEHISENGDIIYDNMKYISENFYMDRTNIKLYKDDIIICKDGATTGKLSIITDKFKYPLATINEHVLRLTLLEEYNPYYVFSFLNSKIGKEMIKNHISGGAQGGITQDILNELIIPIPNMETQIYIKKKYLQMNLIIKKIEKRISNYEQQEIDVIQSVLI